MERRELIEHCMEQLIGDPEEGGHYFTIWAPRQTGKTWLMRQAITEIPNRYGDKFAVYHFSLGDLRGLSWSPQEGAEEIAFPKVMGTAF